MDLARGLRLSFTNDVDTAPSAMLLIWTSSVLSWRWALAWRPAGAREAP